ncbi:hypothetical protein AnigIFM59636_002146 [Aspergillus niger]|nr:hypothetical protein AnigIFM59636_002146 [Aspergillus niger]
MFEANVQVHTSFGSTTIVTLGSPLDLSNSYPYFKNKGKVTAQFAVDAVASVNWNSGETKLIGLDNFPGATFRVPVYASADAAVTLSAHLEAEVNIVSWDIQQTYPQADKYPVAALDSPNYDSIQTLGVPAVEASVSVSGELALHLKPKVSFGIVFDSWWDVSDWSVNPVLDGYVIFQAEASLSTASDNSCLFNYVINAGANVYRQLTAPSVYNWGGTMQVPIASVLRKQITPETCADASTSAKRSVDFLEEFANQSTSVIDPLLSSPYEHGAFLESGDSVREEALRLKQGHILSIGPIITVPESSLSYPGENVTGCLACDSYGSAFSGSLKIRDVVEVEEDSCPWITLSDSVFKFNKDSGNPTVNNVRISGNFANDHILDVQLISVPRMAV